MSCGSRQAVGLGCLKYRMYRNKKRGAIPVARSTV